MSLFAENWNRIQHLSIDLESISLCLKDQYKIVRFEHLVNIVRTVVNI